MDSREYKFDAFISYRHLEPDRSVARAIQQRMETYRPPKTIVKDFRPWRLFLDETELPSASNLNECIEDALESSRFLIVICSPKLVESKWCMREIDRFKELHGGRTDNIIAVIADGLPGEVIPQQLLHETFTRIDENGVEQLIDRDVEPVGANVAAPTEAERKKLLKKEFLRIAAMLCGCEFNDLFDREKKRRQKRRIAIWGSAAALITAIAVYSTAMLFVINSQRKELAAANGALEKSNADLEQANVLLEETNDELESANHELWVENARSLTYLSKSQFDQGDYIAALDSVYSAMPESGSDEKLLADTEAAVIKELEPYSEVVFRPVTEICVEDNMSSMSFTGNGETLAVSYGDYISFYRAADGSLLNTVRASEFMSSYGSVPYSLTLVAPERKIISGIPLENCSGDLLVVDSYGNYEGWRKTDAAEEYDCPENALINGNYSIAMVDGKSGRILWQSSMPENEYISAASWSDSGIFAASSSMLVRFDEKNGDVLDRWDLHSESEGVKIGSGSIKVDGDRLLFCGHPSDAYLSDYNHYYADLEDGSITHVTMLDKDTCDNAYIHSDVFPTGTLIIEIPCDFFGQITGNMTAGYYGRDGSCLWSFTDKVPGYSSSLFAFYYEAEACDSEFDTIIVIYNDKVVILNAETGEVLDRRDLSGTALEAYSYPRGLTFIVTDDGKEICISTRKMSAGSTSTGVVVHYFLTELMKMKNCAYFNGTCAAYFQGLQKVLLYRDIFHDYETVFSGLKNLSGCMRADGRYLAALKLDSGDYSIVVQNTETLDTITVPGYDYRINGLYSCGSYLLAETSEKIDVYDVTDGRLVQTMPVYGLSPYSVNIAGDGESVFCYNKYENTLCSFEPDGAMESFPLQSDEHSDEVIRLENEFIGIAADESYDGLLLAYDSNGLMRLDKEGNILKTARLEDSVVIKGLSIMDGSIFIMCGSGELKVLDPESLQLKSSVKITDFGLLKSSCRVSMTKLEKRNLYMISYAVTSATWTGKTAQACLIDADTMEVTGVFDGAAFYSEHTDRMYISMFNRMVSYPFFEAQKE